MLFLRRRLALREWLTSTLTIIITITVLASKELCNCDCEKWQVRYERLKR